MSGSIQVIMLGGALLAWSAVMYKGLALWRYPSNPAAWAYWAGFLALALNMTLLMPQITGRIDGSLGVMSLTYLICDAAALLTCWIWLVCLYELNKPDRQARVVVQWFGALVIAALAFFSLRFAIAPGQTHHRLSADPQAIYLAAYRLIFVGIIALHMAYFIVLLRRYAAEVQQPTLRLRLHFMMVAAMLVIGFSLNESLRILQLPSPEVIGALFLLAAVLAMVVGLTFSRRLDRLITVARLYRLYLRLYPLWRALYPINPSLSFLAAPSLHRRFFPRDDLSFIICRQVIEIRDWAIALRPFQRPVAATIADAREDGVRTRSDDSAAFGEASMLTAALQSWQRQVAAGPTGPEPALTRRFRLGDALTPAAADWQDTDWQEEARYLARVAHYFVRSPHGNSTGFTERRRYRSGNTP